MANFNKAGKDGFGGVGRGSSKHLPPLPLNTHLVRRLDAGGDGHVEAVSAGDGDACVARRDFV
jgi:hypothetical protein